MYHMLEDDKLLCSIRQDSLDNFCIQRPGTVKNTLVMLKQMNKVGDEVLGLLEGLPNLGPFPLRYELVMGVSCSTLIIYLRKVKYIGHLKWGNTRKDPTAWGNLYEAGGKGGSQRTIFARDERKLVATGCPTRGPWFVNLRAERS